MIAEYIRVVEELVQCPLIQPDLSNDAPQPASEQKADAIDLPELDEDTFDGLFSEFEDAMYDLDEEHMFAVLAQMQGYQYCQASLKEKLAPVKKKVEMSDYMSAVDLVSKIREELKNNREGGSVE